MDVGQWGPTVLRHKHTHKTLTGTLPPPDILFAPPPLTSSPTAQWPPHPHPFPLFLLQDYCALLFRHPHITQNKWVPYFPLSLPPTPPFSYFLSLSFSPSLCADERQALSRQWHSKTSGLGSSVSGYSTLLGAISLSKVWPAYSPTENPQISYYTLHTEGRHSCSLGATGVCTRAKRELRQIKMSKFKTFRVGGRGRNACTTLLFEWEQKWEWTGVLVRERLHVCCKFMSAESHAHLAASSQSFHTERPKCTARRQNPSHQ